MLFQKEGDAELREEQPRNNNVALGQGPGSASKDTHNKIFKPLLELKPLWKDFGQHSSF